MNPRDEDLPGRRQNLTGGGVGTRSADAYQGRPKSKAPSGPRGAALAAVLLDQNIRFLGYDTLACHIEQHERSLLRPAIDSSYGEEFKNAYQGAFYYPFTFHF